MLFRSTGSLKVWFATALRAIPDEGLKNLDWKKAIGALLVKVKYKTIEWLEGKPTIRDVSEIEELRNEILRLKHEVERLRQMPIETSLQLSVVVNIVQRISISLASIPDDQNVTFASPEGTLRVNTAFSVSDEQLREILVRTHRVHRVHVPLVVKRPDYLGVSMWDVIESGHSVKAKIIDQDWLERFHNREVSLLPGDALMAGLRIDAYFDEEGNVFETKYTVEKIEEVVKFNSVQLEMLANDEGESNSSACNSDEVTT